MLQTITAVLFILLITALQASCAPGYDLSPFGINGISPFHGRESSTVFQDAETRAALLKEAGIKWNRFDFWWSVIEPEKGKYDWSFADKVIQFHEQQGIEMLPILCYASAWSKGVSPADDDERSRYGEWVYQTVKRYKGRVKCWEIWNEPNIPTFWSPKPAVEDYTKLLKVAYRRAKEADPDCVIVAGSTSLIDFVFIEEMIKHGGWDSLDVLSVHPYSMAGDPMDMDLKTQLVRLNSIVKATGKPKPVWITEMGWTANRPEESAYQAKCLAQSYAIALACGVEKLFWFCLSDWGESWGIIKSDLRKKPSFEVYKLLSSKLKDTAARFGPCRENRTEVIFTQPDHHEILMIWANGNKPVPASITYKATAELVTGEPVEIRNNKLNITPTPMLVTPTAGGIYGPGAAFAQQKKANLVPNGSLETVGGWNQGRHEGTHKDGHFAWSAAPGSSKKVLALLGAKDALWDSMPIPVFPGKRYTATVKVRAENATGETRLVIAWWHPVGWGWKGCVMSESIPANSKGWVTLKVSGTAPADAGFARVDLFSKDNTGKVWFDDIQLVSDDVPYYW